MHVGVHSARQVRPMCSKLSPANASSYEPCAPPKPHLPTAPEPSRCRDLQVWAQILLAPSPLWLPDRVAPEAASVLSCPSGPWSQPPWQAPSPLWAPAFASVKVSLGPPALPRVWHAGPCRPQGSGTTRTCLVWSSGEGSRPQGPPRAQTPQQATYQAWPVSKQGAVGGQGAASPGQREGAGPCRTRAQWTKGPGSGDTRAPALQSWEGPGRH